MFREPTSSVRYEPVGKLPIIGREGHQVFALTVTDLCHRTRQLRRILLCQQRGRCKGERHQVRPRSLHRWFRNGQKWRTGTVGRISVAKRRYDLSRNDDVATHHWVGLGIIVDNLVSIGCLGPTLLCPARLRTTPQTSILRKSSLSDISLVATAGILSWPLSLMSLR